MPATAEAPRWLQYGLHRIWNGRDNRGHYTTPPTVGKPCPHACCNGTRPHPKGTPVQKHPRRPSVVDEYLTPKPAKKPAKKPAAKPAPKKKPAAKKKPAPAEDLSYLDAWGSAESRDNALATSRRLAAAKRARSGRREHSDDYGDYKAYVDERYDAAVTATSGVMLSKAGIRAGIDPDRFFNYDARSRPGARYMSDELRAWMGDQHVAAGDRGNRSAGLLSYAQWQRQNTRKAS